MSQTILYIYSFPRYLDKKPRVKIGRTSGADTATPEQLARDRILAQIRTAHPENYELLLSVPIPGNWVESVIHDQLKDQGFQVQDTDAGREWFQFPSLEVFQHFRESIYRAVLLEDFSEFGDSRKDITGDDFSSIKDAFGIKSIPGSEFRQNTNFIKSLIDALSPFYPNFSGWLTKTIDDQNSVFNIAIRDDTVVGATIWKPKQNNAVKLATLYVNDEFRDSGIGRNLILSCFEQWREKGISRVYVTTARDYLIPFFERYGFMVEGFTRNAYNRPSGNQLPEWYLSKLMLPEQTLQKQSADLYPALPKSSIFQMGRAPVGESIKENGSICLIGEDGTTIDKVDLNRWLHRIYPCESGIINSCSSGLTPGEAIIIPIYPRFLIEMFQKGKTVYYGSPSFTDKDVDGCRIIFYATAPISGIVAIARVVKRMMGTASDLYTQLGGKGVLSLEQIGNGEITKQAIEFDGLLPINNVIPRQQAIDEGIIKGHPQLAHTLPINSFYRIIEIGGVYVP